MNSEKKIRMTHQRRVILEEVKKYPDHPTADEVYERVRKRLPRISLGTVYRNLDILATCGHISKLEAGRSQMRFDGETADHYHIVCMQCGKIQDAAFEPSDNTLETLEKALGRLTVYGIFGHKLEFIGLCRECKGPEGEMFHPNHSKNPVTEEEND